MGGTNATLAGTRQEASRSVLRRVSRKYRRTALACDYILEFNRLNRNQNIRVSPQRGMAVPSCRRFSCHLYPHSIYL